MPTYDQQQTLFCLSMFANISNSEKVITDLANPTVQGKIGQASCMGGSRARELRSCGRGAK